jgi:hypothetical protein
MEEFSAYFITKYIAFKAEHGVSRQGAQAVLATHISDPSLTFSKSSIGGMKRHFGVDHGTITAYIKSGRLFKGCWKLSH